MQKSNSEFNDKKDEILKQTLKPRFVGIMDGGIFTYLLTGKTYSEIARDYYLFDLNKVIYKVRRLRKKLSLHNRRQLAYFAVVNNLVDLDSVLEEFI